MQRRRCAQDLILVGTVWLSALSIHSAQGLASASSASDECSAQVSRKHPGRLLLQLQVGQSKNSQVSNSSKLSIARGLPLGASVILNPAASSADTSERVMRLQLMQYKSRVANFRAQVAVARMGQSVRLPNVTLVNSTIISTVNWSNETISTTIGNWSNTSVNKTLPWTNESVIWANGTLYANGTLGTFDDLIQSILAGSADSEDECTKWLIEARHRLHEIQENIQRLAVQLNTSELKSELIIREIIEFEKQLDDSKQECEEERDKCAKKRDAEKLNVEVLSTDLLDMKHSTEVLRGDELVNYSSWRPMTTLLQVRHGHVLAEPRTVFHTAAGNSKAVPVETLHAWMRSSKDLETALTQCVASHRDSKNQTLEPMCVDERNRFLDQYVSVTRELTRVIERYKVEIVSHACEDAVEVECKNKEQWILAEIARLEEEFRQLRVDTLKDQLEEIISVEKRLREWVTKITEECDVITGSEDGLDEVKSVIELLKLCYPDEYMDLCVPEWTGQWVDYGLDANKTDVVTDAEMLEVCQAEFGGDGRSVRVAEVAEIIANSVFGMPNNNTGNFSVLGACPMCEGMRNVTHLPCGMTHEHARVCWDPDDPLTLDSMRKDCLNESVSILCVWEHCNSTNGTNGTIAL